MTAPDIQYFPQSGTWVKPAGAVRVDGIVRGSGGGGGLVCDGEDGELHAWSVSAADLPDTLEVTIGAGGRGAPGAGDGAAGYVLVITFLRPDAEPGSDAVLPRA